jgi:hypothetical protein
MKARTKVDWNEACVSYCTPTLDGQYKSYADIAFEYSVSLRAVERRGSRDMWYERRCEVGISKKTKCLDQRYQETTLLYDYLLDTWLMMVQDVRRKMIRALEDTETMTPRQYAQLSKGFAIVTDQILKLTPKPQEIKNNLAEEITDEDIRLFNRFLGKETN